MDLKVRNMRYVYSYFRFPWVFLSLEEATSTVSSVLHGLDSKAPAEHCSDQHGSKTQPSCRSQSHHLPPHDSGLSQPVALLPPQTLSVLQVNSQGSPWYLQSAPRVPYDKHTRRGALFPFAPEHHQYQNQNHPTCTSGASQCHLSQTTGSSWSFHRPRGTSPSRVRSSRQEISQQKENWSKPAVIWKDLEPLKWHWTSHSWATTQAKAT